MYQWNGLHSKGTASLPASIQRAVVLSGALRLQQTLATNKPIKSLDAPALELPSTC
jgi:hypothetical protein